MKTFKLNRLSDESGVSGVGIVAEGVEFHNGKCALCWLPVPISSIVIYDSITDLIAIHGHDGKTVVEWDNQDVDRFLNGLGKIAIGDTLMERLTNVLTHYVNQMGRWVERNKRK